MDYQEFREQPDVTELMLRALGIVQVESRYISITLRPDYTITPDQRQYAAYFFRHSWDFADKYEYVFEIEIADSQIYPDEVIDNICDELGLTKYQEDGDYSRFLGEVRELNVEELMAHSFPTNFGQFELQELRIGFIDNLTKKARYEGSYLGDAGEVEMDIFPFYSFISIKAVPLVMDKFYKDLLAEAYLLLLQHNYKLAYFILYSAFENFVRQADPKRKGKVDQLLTGIFAKKFGDLTGHEIYAAAKSEFAGADKYRNDIGHGNKYVPVSKQTIDDLMSCCLVMICSYEFGLTEFEKLFDHIGGEQYDPD